MLCNCCVGQVNKPKRSYRLTRQLSNLARTQTQWNPFQIFSSDDSTDISNLASFRDLCLE